MATSRVKAIIAFLALASCTCADYVGPWSEWSECFVDTCGSGEQTRSRMLYGLPETRVRECTVSCESGNRARDLNPNDTSFAENIDEEEEMGELNIDLGEPNDEVQYSACNATCGAGKETWILLCGDGRPCGVKFVDCFKDCNPEYISVTYEITKSCDAVCTPSHDGKYAEGFKMVRKLCNGVACGEEPGQCSVWCGDKGYGNPNTGSWGPCSVECGLGTRTRPINSTAIETEYCEEPACKDMMMYSLRIRDSSVNEYDWSACSVECGTGYQAKHCPECGLSKDVRVCEGSKCPESVSAEIRWSEWTDCSAKCGKGTSTRHNLDCEEDTKCSMQEKTCFHSCIGSQSLEGQSDNSSKIYSLRVEGRSSYITSVGESLRITCSALSSSKIALTWLAISNSEKLFNELSRKYLFMDGNVLSYTIMEIQEVQPQHHGNYMCGIVNGQSIYTQIIDVNVLHFTQSPHPGPKTLSAGETISLTCAVYASDDAERIYLRWLYEEKELLSTQHTKFPFISTLVLSSVSERDSGSYRCEAVYQNIVIQSSTTTVNVLTESPYVMYKREEGPREEREWGEWSRCSADCGYGMQVRGKRCQVGGQCTHNEVKGCLKKRCGETMRSVGWQTLTVQASTGHDNNQLDMEAMGPWSDWSECTSCYQLRTRECLSSVCNVMSLNDVGLCNDDCDDDVSDGNERTIALSQRSEQEELSSFYQVYKRSASSVRYQWERNSRCSADCGFGVTVKQAVCDGDCPKVKFETSVCLNTFCNGTNVQEMSLVTVTTGDFGATMLGEWSSWGQCECGHEVQRRTRGCYSGYGCPESGVLSASRSCACGTGAWGDWTEWGECSKRCGRGGVKHKSRACLLEPCLGEMTRSESCFVAPCTTSTLSAWSGWSPCTNSGGVYTRYKSRSCEQYNNHECEGSLYNVEICFPDESATENKEIGELNTANSTDLGAWVNAGECLLKNGLCGIGEQVKMRECFMVEPHTCPQSSMQYDECSLDNIGTCTDIFRFVECWISCGGSETEEEEAPAELEVPVWSNIGTCRVEHYMAICGKGYQAQVLSCYNSNSCSQEVLAQCSGSELFTCTALFRSVECHAVCDDDWKLVPDDCWEEPCEHITINVNITEGVFAFKTKYSSRVDFYGAVEFWRGAEYVGLAAWSTKGAYLEGCGYEEAPFERDFNDTFSERLWTVAINRTHIWLLMDNVVMVDYYRFDEGATCRDRYQDAKIDNMVFRNLKAVRAEYQFIGKGELGEWESVGPCTIPSADMCGAGVQIEAQTCYKDNSCPVTNYKSCSEENFFKCSGQFRTRSCEVPCEGELETFGGCITNEECGRGEMVLIYSCYFTNSCPPEYYRADDCDDFFSCSLLFSVVPCSIPCKKEHTELGAWVNHGECTVIGAGARCGPEAGSLLQVRSCIESKSCPPSTVSALCDDPWQCSDFFRSIDCNVECTEEEILDDEQIRSLGPWEDLHSCIVNTEEGCGFGTLPQVRGCYKTKSCPAWAASALYCNGLTNCTELFRSVQCVVSCQDTLSERALGKWEDLGQCQPNDGVCGAGEQVKVRSCYKDYSCPKSSKPQHCSTFFTCSSNVFKTMPCTLYCDDSASEDGPAELVSEAIGEWVDYGECQPLEAKECGEGEILQIRECQMRKDCPQEKIVNMNFCMEDLISCSKYFRTKHCYKSCYDFAVKLTTTAPTEALDIIKPRSCQEILNSNLKLRSGVYKLYVDEAQFDVWCEMMVDEEKEQYNGWTLISSFVNDEHLSWGGNTQKVKENWQGTSTFGSIGSSKERDFKSKAWSMVQGSELLVEDRFGTLQFNLKPRKLSMYSLMSNHTRCSTTPFVGPRYNTRASNRVWRQHAIFAIYPALSEKGECAVLNPQDRVFVPVLAFGGQACSLMGAGMSTLKYAQEGMDWHMSLNPTTSCNAAGCDNTRCSGPWFEHTLATSLDKNFEEGSHDESKWGRLFIK